MVDSPYQLVQDFFHQQKPLKISLSSKGRLLSSSPINFQERAVRFRVIFRGSIVGKKRNFIFRHALPGGGYVALRIRLYVLRKGLGPLHSYSFRMGLETETSYEFSEGTPGSLGLVTKRAKILPHQNQASPNPCGKVSSVWKACR